MESSSQALTSVHWYQEALAEQVDTRGAKIGRWLRGIAFLRVHISLYFLGIVVLFAINLIRSPDRLWIDKVAMAWAALIVVHAAIAGLIWAFGLLKQGDTASTAGGSKPQPRSSWISVRNTSPQDADFRMASTATRQTAESPAWGRPKIAPDGAASVPPPVANTSSLESPRPAGASLWDGWTTSSKPPAAGGRSEFPYSSAPGDERASWKEASAAAWLTRDADLGESPSPSSTPLRSSTPQSDTTPT